MKPWEFWIDVGGTFTDCIARAPDDDLIAQKVLSSAVTKGQLQELIGPDGLLDPSRRSDPDDFWVGYPLRCLDPAGQPLVEARVTAFDAATGRLTIDQPLPASVTPATVYELVSPEEAPILAIRRTLALRLDEPIPEIQVRLGTTRGTNALLTREGARTVLVTTRGFADVPLIGNQDRPRLFDLVIHKPEPLFERVVEVDERIDAEGSVLRPPGLDSVAAELSAARAAGIESVAICLLHSFANPEHELQVERVAREAGFEEVSRSSRLSPLIKVVSRTDTTLVDAYLNPILRQYVSRLRESLGASSLKIMTSAGGLIDADRFVGKDSILSGPAGGVIGFSRIAERAGFSHSIGFDMGGTSTDVSRYDGSYEREFETRKAGVRIVSPMLAIETVAAGGGSICHFDGVKLAVGPSSAGADPGPACYGRGGPLTVTDINVHLGRVLPERFPFPLDTAVVTRRLETLCEQIADSPMGRRYTPTELAEGFVQIANANMVRAIRNISVAKGYDPADYVLVTFGGAGAQHACSIAAELGIQDVLVHPFAGILSAYGMGLADVRRFAERSVLRPFDDETLADLEEVFAELEDQASEEVRAEGVLDERIARPLRTLEIRYQGVEAAIAVPRPDDGDYASRYAQLHQQLYGYVHRARQLEITAARVEVIGTTADPPLETTDARERVPQPRSLTETVFDGQPHQTAVFLRNDLHPGDRIDGPAILCESTSTVVIEPGYTAGITIRDEVHIRRQSDETAASDVSTTADPVMLEIFNNLFASIAEQMGLTLQRTSFSTNVKERLDFSCAIFSTDGDLVVNAPHIPVHLGAMSETVKRILADNPGMVAGDVFVTNDPYRGGSHLPDVTVITPVHDPESGQLLFFTASRAHHAEIGGIVPGSMPPFSKNLGEEGVLIRNFRLVDAGRSRETELEQLLGNGEFPSRSIGDNLADVSAQVAANNSGVEQLRRLVERYTLPVVQAYMSHIQQAASRKMRLALAGIPDGTMRRTDHLDNGSPICVAISIDGETARVDFSGTGPVMDSNLNANRAIVTAACLYVFRCLIAEDIPLNSGVLEPVTIELPECLLNPPEQANPAESAAVVGGNVETSQRVVDTLLGALGVAAASQGTMNNLTFGDETFGYYETICGGAGATPTAAGTDAIHTDMTNTRLTDVEVIERRYPVRLHEFSIRHGSGGAGRHRGGAGIVRRIEFLKPLSV
ncbi:MAG: hydantoinase B/oxoprolinase family protein, partial [Planctomycetaceae bacterium]|nr:hydantoinase B/oxoprolinase family protein [Planctomycetaceae bacterium]